MLVTQYFSQRLANRHRLLTHAVDIYSIYTYIHYTYRQIRIMWVSSVLYCIIKTVFFSALYAITRLSHGWISQKLKVRIMQFSP